LELTIEQVARQVKQALKDFVRRVMSLGFKMPRL
jgi:hypothetical protein